MAAPATSFLRGGGGSALLLSPALARLSLPSPSALRRSHLPPSGIHSYPLLRTCASLPDHLVAETPPPPPAPAVDPAREAAESLDIRVGRVLRAWRHPEADSLYVEEVDVGEPEPRTICSGLVSYVPLDRLQGSDVVVLANLKPRNMRGIKSNGMLMAASDAAHENVELLVPPEGSAPGERVWFGTEEDRDAQAEAATPNQVQKKKLWETVQPHLKTTETCEAVLLGVHPMRTLAGIVRSCSLKNANIS